MSKDVFYGLKILDLGWIVAVPWTCKYFADHGAEVIRVESKVHPDMLRTTAPYKDGKPGLDNAAYFVNYNNNEYGLSINLKDPNGVEIIKKLVASWADIVVENYSPGVMKRWGLDYDELKKIKNNIIMFSSSQMGQTGPQAHQSGTGNQMTALAGFSHVTGWPDLIPSLPYGAYTDCTPARLGAVAIIAALDYRNRTGEGQYIDMSQYEASIQSLTPTILDFVVNGRVAVRRGNYSSRAAPHNVYPCKGEDRWCAIAVYTEKEWECLCGVIGELPWVKDPKFATLLSRKNNEDELDMLIAEWTTKLPAEEIMIRLQSVGVPAGVVQNCRDLSLDPQLKTRQYFWEVDHPVMGKNKFESEAFELPDSPRRMRMPAPLIGQHNEYICTKILGMSDMEFVKLLNQGVFE